MIYSGEDPPGVQGFAQHQYDICISTNCIHATKHLCSTVGNIALILNDTGSLIFNEAQLPGNYNEDMGFGMTDGWWMFVDVERRGFPLMRGLQWNELFRQIGYFNNWYSAESGFSNIQSILMATITWLSAQG